MSEQRNISIAGAGALDGGEYDAVVINGVGNVSGDITCDEMKVNGTCRISRNANVDQMIVNGAAQVGGAFQGRSIQANGNLKVAESVECGGDCEVGGGLSVGSNLRAQSLKSHGSLNCGGSVECEKAELSGLFKIEGLLNAEQLSVEISGDCVANEIGGSEIRVVDAKSFSIMRLLSFGKPSCLRAESIEGNQISLEVTSAKVVRGNNVVIGEGCVIDRVEYKDFFTVEGNGQVKEVVRIEA